MEFIATLSPSREIRLTTFQTILLRRVAIEGRVEVGSPEGLNAAKGMAEMGLVHLADHVMTSTSDGERALMLLVLDGVEIPVLDVLDIEE